MRILLVIMGFYPDWGGTENQARRQAAELVRRGHSVEVVTWKGEASLPDEGEIEGIHILRTERRTQNRRQRLWSVLRMVGLLARRAKRADVLVAHQVQGLAFLAGWIALAARRPIAAKFAGSTACASDLQRLTQPGWRGWLVRLAAWPLRRRGVAVVMTEAIERDAGRAGFRWRTRIPNGVVVRDRIDRAAVRTQLVSELGIEANRPIVMTAGRFDPVKGFDVLLAAWPVVVRHCPGAQLVIVGGGAAEGDLGTLVRARGIEDSVRLAAPSERTDDWISGADVAVIPSRAEGMSNVMLEAMAAGTAVVSTAVSGAVDLIRDGENGRLVPVENPAALATALVDTLRSPGDMGRLARETVRSCCALERVVDRYEEMFARIRRGTPALPVREGAG